MSDSADAAEREADDGNDSRRVTRDRVLLAAVLAVGIVGTGVVRRQLGLLGYNGLGRLVFVLGFGGTVFVVWYGWIRPLDITGPTADETVHPPEERAEDGEDARGE